VIGAGVRESSGFADIDGARLYYESTGSGPPLVLVHGFALDRRVWDEQCGPLAERFSVLRYDCRGFGASSIPTGNPYTHSGDLRALLEYMEVDAAVVVGLSMGGQIALELATLHPERVTKLILTDPWLADFTFSDDWKSLWGALAEKGRAGDVDAAKEIWRERGPLAPALRRPAVAAQIERMIADYSGWHFRNVRHFPFVSVADRLGEIEAPTLVVMGEIDRPDFHEIAELVVRRIRDARKAVVPGAGHLPNMEIPAGFNDLIVEFLVS
jgi:pimeloyl-ACP methyl ester carboxylesterase